MADDASGKVVKSEAEWRAQLSPEQYHVCREHGTERAFSGKYAENKDPGVYVCVGCGNPLFDSDTKFDSGTGWPSFFQPVSADAVDEKPIQSFSCAGRKFSAQNATRISGMSFPTAPRPRGCDTA